LGHPAGDAGRMPPHGIPRRWVRWLLPVPLELLLRLHLPAWQSHPVGALADRLHLDREPV